MAHNHDSRQQSNRPRSAAVRAAASGTSLLRSLNAAAILRTLHREGPCSRARLTRLTGMSPPTVSRIVARLIERGLVVEVRRGESTGGRRPVLLQIDEAKLYAVGVQVQRDRVSCLLSDLRGAPLGRRAYPPFDLEPEGLIRELARELDGLIRQAGVDRRRVLGIGVGVAGVVDAGRGVVVRSVNLGWRDVPAAERLERLLGLPVVVQNDANAAAMAELWFGPAPRHETLMFLKTEAGVGAGILVDGRLISGPRGMAGEIGHVTVVEHGHPCRCGHAGCLETYVNLQDVLERYRQRTGQAVDKPAFFQRAQAGDPVARQLVDEAASALAHAVVYAGMLLDLQMVVIGGVWGQISGDFLQTIEARHQATAQRTGLHMPVTIRGSSLGDDSELLGAIGFVVDRWFSPGAIDLSSWRPAPAPGAAGAPQTSRDQGEEAVREAGTGADRESG